MLTKMKRTACLTLAAVCLMSVNAFAADWRIKDYDTTNAMAGAKPVVPIVYQEFDVNGLPTGRVVSGVSAQAEGLKGFADATLKNSWVSDVYPNNEYIGLYADGVYTGKVFATGRDGKDLVEYKDVDFMWEAAAPHRIYSITKAKLFKDGKVQWFGTEAKNYPVQYTGRNAEVVAERIAYGFAGYDVRQGGKVSLVPEIIENNYKDERAYSALSGISKEEINPTVIPFELTGTSCDKANVVNVTGRDIFIPRTYDVKLTGPSFTAEGTEIKNGKTIIGSALKDPSILAIPDVVGVCTELNGNIIGSEITWTVGGFEKAAPYKLYEYLTVDGVVMDGSLFHVDKDHNKYYKPAIFRYTGATANLKFKTIVNEVDANGEVILDRLVSYDGGEKYVSEGVFVRTGIYPNAEYEVRTGKGDKTLTPVYKFYYNGDLYSTYEINGEWFTELWGNFHYKANEPEAWIAPYVG